MLTKSEKITLHNAFRRGLKWIDKEKPNWFRKIKIKHFNLGDSNYCVLGQAFMSEVWANGFHCIDDQMPSGWIPRHGFDGNYRLKAGFNEQYSYLSEHWLQAIRDRKRGARA